ncbi:hypothetical protein [uncultured Ruminococcus sp.]|uniref:hypothetical protein n=1 Tax=uncultured Ruminococcus sp. TaxID=165186 RepID=UPI00260D4E48|nr:hypothetical protein [uncultured Ruminococcus sp.]
MNAMLYQYGISLHLLKSRIEELRQQMKDSRLSPLETQSLEARRRLLSEEVHEIEQVMETILPYSDAEAAVEQAGDSFCA